MFKKRRRAGFTLSFSLVIMVLGGLFFLGLESPEEASANQPVKGVDSPEIAQAPEPADPRAGDEARDTGAKAERKVAAANAQAKAEVARQDTKESRAPKPKAPPRPSIPTPATKDMWMSVPKMGLYNNYVANTDAPGALDQGAIKLPSTGFPWQQNANPYIAGHVLGYQGTASWQQFANLPYMDYGDVIYLGDANGTTYTYKVTEIFTVAPHENWVTHPVNNRDMVTLQTCLNPPAYDVRLVVRADRVNVQPA